MEADKSTIVKEFSKELENACFSVGPVSDSEVESWLYRPGPDRLQLLQWCLGRLEPALRDRFQSCDEEQLEKRTIAHVKAWGLSHNVNAILGLANEVEQTALWRRILALFKVAESSKDNKDKSKQKFILKSVSSLNRSKEFLDLLHVKMKLLPPEMKVLSSALPVKNAEEELKTLHLKLETLQGIVDSLTSDSVNDESPPVDQSVHTSDEYEEIFFENFKKIQVYYNHISKTIFPCIRKQPDSPTAQILGSCIENLADHVIAFVQMLQAKEKIRKIAVDFETNDNSKGSKSSEVSEIQESISKCHSLASEILSLWRIHKLG